jgi:hypothetical protein
MKKKLLLIMLAVVLSFSLMASDFVAPVAGEFSPKKLTMVNKAEGPIAFKLVPIDGTDGYIYDELPSGSKEVPYERTYSIIPGEYYFYVFYWKETRTYNAELGEFIVSRTRKCQLPVDSVLYYDTPILDMTKNYKRTILPCDGPEPASLGEPNIDKFWYPGYIETTDVPWYQLLHDWMSYYLY